MNKGEFFYETEDGKEDIGLHQPILTNPEADKKAQQESADALKVMGLDPSIIKEMYPLAL